MAFLGFPRMDNAPIYHDSVGFTVFFGLTTATFDAH